jgi:hypothetical protein
VSWPALSPGLWRGKGPAEIALEGASLRARRGTIAWDFDLTAPGIEVGFHHWGLSRGTLLRVSAGNSSLFVGGEGFLSSDLRYEVPLTQRPDLILSRQHFDALVAQLPKHVFAGSQADRSYWLWNNGLRLLPALVHVLYVGALLLAMGISVRHAPRGRGAVVAAGFLAVLVVLERVRNRRAARPALRLTLRRDCLVFARANSAVPLAECSLGKLDVRPTHWSAPTMGRTSTYATVDLPSVVVTKALPQPLTIGGLGYWEATRGAKAVPPRYLLSPPCWASFAEALLGRATTSAATEPELARQDTGSA